MASKKSGGAVATKKKPRAPTKPAPAAKARPKVVSAARKAVKPPAKKALTINVVKKPAAPPPAPKPATPGRSLYNVHPGVSMMQKWISELKQKTGRNLDEWISVVRTSGPSDVTARRIWLKEKHKLGTNSAWWIAERADPANASLVDDDPQAYLRAAVRYVEEMYAGKATLKPLHDRLLEIAHVMGRDVRVCPCKTVVPIYRRHVIAQIFPASRTRIDFGLALRDTPASGRLIETGGWERKDRITHRIPITSLAEIDSEVERWLRFAYELDA